jgi:hypothetical protein
MTGNVGQSAGHTEIWNAESSPQGMTVRLILWNHRIPVVQDRQDLIDVDEIGITLSSRRSPEMTEGRIRLSGASAVVSVEVAVQPHDQD